MNRRSVLFYEKSQLLNRYKSDFQEIYGFAVESETSENFKHLLHDYVSDLLVQYKNDNNITGIRIANRWLRLISYDNVTIPELSTDESLHISTLSMLWLWLKGEDQPEASIDLFIDLYHQLRLLQEPVMPEYSKICVKHEMSRWPSGLDSDVIAIREENKRRIIECLIRKIDRRHAVGSKYVFDRDWDFDTKLNHVKEWWSQSRFHLAMAIKTPAELNTFLGGSLSEQTMSILNLAKRKGIPFFITPYYISLLNTTDQGYDDLAIRSYILYSEELVETYGDIKAWEKEDLLESGKPNAAGWLLPDGCNIHRRYPEVAILIPDSMGRACGGLCASCQRMYGFQHDQLNFDLEALKPKESWDRKLRRLMNYFEEDAQLRDILVTGGDALMSQNATLRNILDAICKMALRKRKANELRKDGEKYAELQRVRLGSRLLAYLPCRVNDELIAILKEFKEKASAAGVSQFIIQTHFQSPLEVTPEARKAIDAILSAGWIITNQLVYTVAASRRGHTAKLRQTLNELGVLCYYTFSVKGFNENYAVFTPNSRSLQEQQEEKIYGKLSADQELQLMNLIESERPLGKKIVQFLKNNKLLFAATDRNVMNLPAIGKSLTFETIGITSSGKRILKFHHDQNRRHSPIIDQMDDVFIVENKSIAAYLRQLKEIGEDVKTYNSIWNYCEGDTESRFPLYIYPEYPFVLTEKMTNLEIEND